MNRGLIYSSFVGCLLAGCLTVVSGCGPRLEYEIRLLPTAEGFSRHVTVKVNRPADEDGREDTAVALPDDVQQRLTGIYGPGEIVDDVVRFKQKFTDRTPDDLGGSGLLQRFPSDLGIAFVYHERVQGHYPTTADQSRRREAVDQFVDYLLGWLKAEWKDEPGSDRITQLLDQKVRADLHDLRLLLESLSYALPKLDREQQPAPFLDVLHFLVERGYLTLEDVVPIVTNWTFVQEDPESWWSQRLHDYLRRQVGDAVSDDSLAIFLDSERLTQSLTDHLRALPEYERYREDRAGPDKESEPDPLGLLTESLAPVTPLLSSAGHDKVTLLLQLDGEPIETDGEWDAGISAVRWKWNIRRPNGDEPTRPPRMPRIAYASWSQPDENAQRERLGEVLLTGEPLRAYCGWFSALSPEEVERWNDVLAQWPSRTYAERYRLVTGFREDWAAEGDFPAWLKRLLKS